MSEAGIINLEMVWAVLHGSVPLLCSHYWLQYSVHRRNAVIKVQEHFYTRTVDFASASGGTHTPLEVLLGVVTLSTLQGCPTRITLNRQSKEL